MSEGNAYCLPYAEAQCFRHTNILLLTEYLEGSVVIVSNHWRPDRKACLSSEGTGFKQLGSLNSPRFPYSPALLQKNSHSFWASIFGKPFVLALKQ
jgi:hypothetical protein